MSLQNPVGRPSMIGRGIESKRSVPTTTSWVSRAAASVSPTEAYSGSVKLPSGLTSAGRAVGASEDRVGRGQVRLARGLVDDHHVPGDVAGGEDARRGRAKLGVHLDVAARVGLDPGGGEVEPGGVRDPADRDDGERRVDVAPAHRAWNRPAALRRGRARSARSFRRPRGPGSRTPAALRRSLPPPPRPRS